MQGRLESPYSKLLKNLELPQETQDKLLDILAEKEVTTLEAFELSKGGKAALNKLGIAAIRADLDGEIESLLGPEKFSEYTDYASTLAIRNHLDNLETRLSYRSTPLSPGQYEALVAALYEYAPPAGASGYQAYLGRREVESSEVFLEASKSVLSAEQYAVYREMAAQHALSKEMESAFKPKQPKRKAPKKNKR